MVPSAYICHVNGFRTDKYVHMWTAETVPLSLELEFLHTQVAASYVVSSALTVLVWDILLHLSDDIELLLLPKTFRLPTIAYFISRYMFLAFFIFEQFSEDIEGQCTPAIATRAVALSVIGYIALITTLLQFLVRVKAIFCHNRPVQWFFTFIWLLAAGGASLLIQGATSGICNSLYAYYVPVISVLVHDSCVFGAISYRIYRMPLESSRQISTHSRLDIASTLQTRFKKRIATLWGKNLPSLTRALLREGQLYYLISLTGSISTLWLMLDTSLISPKRLLLAPVHSVVLSVTAGHVFREVRLGRMREREMSIAVSTRVDESQRYVGAIVFCSRPGDAGRNFRG
ncbi:hypothetical protein BT96DRAFT_116886 [Gymnopus androsaceus JB14]|uniref:DUF6533 domain-containing protein n=1 Tax=Gymnopus androsaceus JB14 TaxID=1447944 RepID=A0A6A4HD78_9AGAR|nr:hypothetical protein BT96DRAFT_116886 [Gymnopus androsaceus JB14]